MANDCANFDRIIREAEKKARARDLQHRRLPFSLTRRTLNQLQKLFRFRYGPRLPEDDAGREDLATAFMYIATNRERVSFAGRWAPWLSPDQALELAEEVGSRPRWPNARALGDLLRITYSEIRTLNIRGIRPIDRTDAELAEISRLARNARKRMKRKLNRADKAAPDSQTKPWEAEGISRSTWYARRTKSGPCNTTYFIGTGFSPNESAAEPTPTSTSGDVDPRYDYFGKKEWPKNQSSPSSSQKSYLQMGAAPAARKALNENWKPSASGRRYAASRGMPPLQVADQAEGFILWHLARGKTPWPNIEGAWKSWCDRYVPYETERRELRQQRLDRDRFWANRAA